MNSRPALFGLLVAAMGGPALANDFPTVDRIFYVQDCMKEHPGPNFEMVSKCACAADALASEVSYDDYVTMITVVKAISIAGEAGSVLRDNETIKPQIKRYRELQAKALKACFIGTR
jgi:hypothetical protein